MATAAQFLSGVHGGLGGAISVDNKKVNALIPWDVNTARGVEDIAAVTGGTVLASAFLVDITGAIRVDEIGFGGDSSSHAKGVYVDVNDSSNPKVESVMDTVYCTARTIDTTSVAYTALLDMFQVGEAHALDAGDTNAAGLLNQMHSLIYGAMIGVQPGTSAYPAMIHPAPTDNRLGM